MSADAAAFDALDRALDVVEFGVEVAGPAVAVEEVCRQLSELLSMVEKDACCDPNVIPRLDRLEAHDATSRRHPWVTRTMSRRARCRALPRPVDCKPHKRRHWRR